MEMRKVYEVGIDGRGTTSVEQDLDTAIGMVRAALMCEGVSGNTVCIRAYMEQVGVDEQREEFDGFGGPYPRAWNPDGTLVRDCSQE